MTDESRSTDQSESHTTSEDAAAHHEDGDSIREAEAETAPAPSLNPVAAVERVVAVDTLRGFALMGILVINIYAFSMPFVAFTNPLLWGGFEGIHKATWVTTHLLFEAKFMPIFSMLFGAGLILMHQRAEARGGTFGGIYYRRMFWLLVIGAMHGFFLWFGDILFHYAFCGLLLYPFRRRSPRALILVGMTLLLIGPMITTTMGSFFATQKAAGEAAEAALAAGEELSEEQDLALKSWAESKKFMDTSPEEIQRQVDVHRGSYGEVFKERLPAVAMMYGMMTFVFVIWRAGGLMLIGMALMKLGVFSAERSVSFYRNCILIGYGLGLPVVAVSAHQLQAHQFDGIYLFKTGMIYNYFGSLGVAMGHIGVVMLICRSGALAGLRARLAKLGQMALSNYLAHTIILTTVFYGYGLGLFGHVDRFYQMGFVVVVLALQLVWSPWWLARYRFGPFEWLWRSLTYWQRQPMAR